ncbi:hypothetical protein LPUS_05536 [Lasallia pustulata]|uniref:Uncharacterized protein n=1 Tax=Lasallia pustulata TaxID=136370 RepID=A0A1W5CZE2_9LECA|nr:hypothetical protein LPUS_05536 [Lasallia pustulata]
MPPTQPGKQYLIYNSGSGSKKMTAVTPSKASYEKSSKERKELEDKLSVANRENEVRLRELDSLKGLAAIRGKETQKTLDENQKLTGELSSEIASLKVKLQEAERKNDDLKEDQWKMKERWVARVRVAQEALRAVEALVVKPSKEEEKLSEGVGLEGLQPPGQVSDEEVTRQYDNLCEQVARWVAEEFQDPYALQKEMEVILARQHFHKLLGKHFGHEQVLLARDHASSHRLILQYLIQCHLEHSILGENIYLFGLGDREAAFLQTIEDRMNVQTPQDAMKTRRWKSETLTMISKQEIFQRMQHEQAEEVSRAMYSTLSYLMPSGQDGCKKLHKCITMPAVRLATTMRLSTAAYGMYRVPPRTSDVFEEDFKQRTILNVETSKIVNPNHVAKVGRNGQIGEEKLMVYPGIQRCWNGAQGNVVLCKPLIVVDFDVPLRRSS